MVRGASVRNRGYLQDLCGELPRSGSPSAHPRRSADSRQPDAGDSIRDGLTARDHALALASEANDRIVHVIHLKSCVIDAKLLPQHLFQRPPDGVAVGLWTN